MGMNIFPGLLGGSRAMANQATILEAERMKKEAEARAFARQQQTSSQDFEREKALRMLLEQIAIASEGRAEGRQIASEERLQKTPSARVALLNALKSGNRAEAEEVRAATEFGERESPELRDAGTQALIAQRGASAYQAQATGDFYSSGRLTPTTPAEEEESLRDRIEKIQKRASEIEKNSRRDIEQELTSLESPLAISGMAPGQIEARKSALRAKLGTLREDSLETARMEETLLREGHSPPPAEIIGEGLPTEDVLMNAVRQAFIGGNSAAVVFKDLIGKRIPEDQARRIIQEVYGEGAFTPQLSAPIR